jgi:hypothetical protein
LYSLFKKILHFCRIRGSDFRWMSMKACCRSTTTAMNLMCISLRYRPWEANSHSAGQENPHLLWTLKVNCCVHNTCHWFLSQPSWIQSTLCFFDPF